MTESLEGLVIVVTGGCGLLGSKFVQAISDAGAITVIADIASSKATALTARLTHEDPRRRIQAHVCDICDAASLDHVREQLLTQYGQIDGLVNNAYPRNPGYGRPIEEVTFHDFCTNVGAHVGGYFLTIQRLLPALRRSGVGGTIINMGSIYGVVAPRFAIYEGTSMTMPVEYSVIKSGIIHLTRYLAQYLKHEGIRVNALSPGGIADGQPAAFRTNYNGFGGKKGMLDPEDVTGTLLFLLGPGSKYVTGQNILVDDGWSL